MKKGVLFLIIAIVFLLSFSFAFAGFVDNILGKITGNAASRGCTDTCSSFGFECGTQRICNRNTNCGSCTNLHGTTSCVVGKCNPICSTGYSNCDLNTKNGCETQLGTNANCGLCGNACASGQTCTGGICVSPCDLTSASWSVTSATQGQLVRLDIAGTNCNGKTITFGVWEKDGFLNSDDAVVANPLNILFSGTSSYWLWTAEWQDDTDGGQSNPPEYYFIAKVSGTTESIESSNSGVSDLLLLTVTQPITCGDNGCQAGETCSSCPADCGVCPPVCGNAVIETGEQCDCGTDGCIGSELNGQTCQSLIGVGYTGSLTCTQNCEFDTSSCVAPCTPNCAGKVCGNNGCGGSCGTCSVGYTCIGNSTCMPSNGTCTDTCASLGYQCGTVCGVDCGSCTNGYTCSSGVCMPSTTCTDTCSSLGYQCGVQTICGVNTNCGSCSVGYTCSSGTCIPSNTTGTWTNELLTNGGFELGSLTGWTTSGANWAVGTHPWATYSDSEGMHPQAGSYCAYYSSGPGSASYYIQQDVNLMGFANYIDAGTAIVSASGWGVSAEYDCDGTRIRISFLNSAKQTISIPLDTNYIESKYWWKTEIYSYPIPTGTRYIRIWGNTYESCCDSGSLDSFSVKIKPY